MRISLQTLIMLLICLLGGLAVYGIVGIKYQNLSAIQSQRENSLLLAQQSQYLEAGVSQWFVNLDLFFSYQEGYLASGIETQSRQLITILSTLQDKMSSIATGQKNEGPPNLFNSLKQRILAIKNLVAQAAQLKSAEGEAWNRMLSEVDGLSGEVVEKLEALLTQIATYSELNDDALVKARREFNWLVVISLLAYVVVCFGVWRWATVNLVRPIEVLTSRTRIDGGKNAHFVLDKGPREVLQLGASFNDFADLLKAEKEKAIHAKERVSAIMKTAPSAIITTDEQGNMATLNSEVALLFGYSDEALLGQAITLLVPNLKISAIDAETMRMECSGIKQDGSSVAIELSASKASVNPSQYTFIIQDITLRKTQERKVKKLNQRLVDASRKAGIAEVAASILHNIGNVLNSVNTAVSMISHTVTTSRSAGLQKAVELMRKHEEDLAEFFSNDPKGRQLYDYFGVLAEQLVDEQKVNMNELADLQKNIKHIEMIINSQQQHAHHTGVVEEIQVQDIIEDSLNMNVSSLENYDIRVEKQFHAKGVINVDRHKLMQIVVNLVRNAKDALVEANVERPVITIMTSQENQRLNISVSDNGIGMSEATIEKLFSFGFTTKDDGHGFGLHSSSLEAKNMGGALRASSQGEGMGATFTLELPLEEKESDNVAA